MPGLVRQYRILLPPLYRDRIPGSLSKCSALSLFSTLLSVIEGEEHPISQALGEREGANGAFLAAWREPPSILLFVAAQADTKADVKIQYYI